MARDDDPLLSSPYPSRPMTARTAITIANDFVLMNAKARARGAPPWGRGGCDELHHARRASYIFARQGADRESLTTHGKILVAGAGGFIGGHLVAALTSD